MLKLSKNEKIIWNEAVKATLKEVAKFNGIIPDEDERKFLTQYVKNKVAYKRVN